MTRLVLDLVRPYHRWLAIVFVAMLLETAMSMAGPWPLKVVIDNVLGSHPLPEWLHWMRDFPMAQSKIGLAALAAIGVVAIAAVGALASYIDNYYTESVGQWVAHDLRVRIYDHLQRMSLGYFDHQQTGVLLSTITNDVATVQDFASSATLGILVDLLTIVGIVVLMFLLNWDFALLAVGVTPFLLLFVARFKKAVKKAQHEVRLHQSEIVSVVQQGLESVRVVKAFGRQDLEESRLAEASHATVDAALKARKVKSLLSPVVTIVVAICTAIVLWRGASLIVAGAMTIGALTVFLAYLSKFFKPVQDLAKMTNAIAAAAVALERIQGILETDNVIPDRPGATELTQARGEIVLENVAFGYDPKTPILRDVSFRIAPGQMVGVVGTTGGGKSTVVGLIPRFYDASSGRVMVDGRDVRDYTKKSLRSQIGFVLQDTVLFRGTIRENIAYGRPGATEDEITAAAKLANAHDFISAMAHGYDSAVGERGLTLSGGQRQRIGIARAIIRNTPILILDEPTAALDTESEWLVIEGLERLMKGRTVITIAHRLSTIRDAHKIIVLKDGVVAEQGTHDELVALGGVYAELHRIQYEQPGGPAAAPAASTPPSPARIRTLTRHAMARSLIVLPDDSAQPILDAIASAKKSLRIKMFVFSDASLIAAVIGARQRGLKVRVMLNPARRSGETENEASRAALIEGGVEVEDSNSAFDLTHEKSMVVDDSSAFVKSLNWDSENLTATRDYAVVTDDPGEVNEIMQCFEADWSRSAFDPGESARLIWCNNNGRARIAHFIDQAKDSIFVQNERYQDPVILERLVRARARGVKVHVMARPPHTLKKDKMLEGVSGLRIMHDVGIKVHKLKHLKLHAKMLLADEKSGIVGSINLAPGSFDARRELGIEVRDKDVVKRLAKVAQHDWEHSSALDLSDEGLLADLEKRHAEKAGADTLVLAGAPDKPKKPKHDS